MFAILKDLLSISVVSSIVLSVLSAICRKYVYFRRRDFFSRPSLEQIEAIKWLRQSAVKSSEPLDLAEQQIRLQSFGLHRDWDLSYKLIIFQSNQPLTYLPSLKKLLRWPGFYSVTNGQIHLHRQIKWILPLTLFYILFIMGSDVFKSYSGKNISQFLLSLTIVIATFLAWCWVTSSALTIYRLGKKLNEYSLPEITTQPYADDFSSILNARYPRE